MSRHSKDLGQYHHGNLKAALVDAYIELLASTPPEKLSLRKLAAHLGVVPTAVYNHFADKEALTTAVKIRCLRHFAEYLEQNHQDSATPEANLCVLGKNYYRYSLEHDTYFKIMFQQPTPMEHVSDELIEAGMQAEEKLRKLVVALLEHHQLPVNQYNEGLGAFACWAMTHGISTLAKIQVNHAACMCDRWPAEFMMQDQAAVDQAFEALNQVLVSGILAAARKN